MARWVMVVLLCSVVRADDYGGASMPQYAADYAAPSPALDDYRSAPAQLDYKYDEESQGITELPINNIESDTWKKPVKKHRGLREPDGGIEVERVPKLKSSRRFPRHRSRLKSEESRGKDELARRSRRGRHGRRRDDDSNSADYLLRNEYRGDNTILDEDIDTFTRRETTERIIRRKPRDRVFVNPPNIEDSESEGDMMPDRKLKLDKSMEYDDVGMRRRPGIGDGGAGGARYRPTQDDDDDEAEVRERPRPKQYPDYNDYYDMRRVNDIKNKLPMLYRRTTTRGTQPATALYTRDLLAMLTARRAGGERLHLTTPPPPPPPTQPPPLEDPPEPPEPPATITPTATTPATSPSTTASKSILELSIAEKSRLSILKKVQKKEKVRGEPTSKPPVLLQVTNKLPTVVMVEPPTSVNPWMRARQVSNDSPKKLEKVKRLMRQKVVASAKSIQDLTDNWDEMVCDYIDVSLLEGSAGPAVGALEAGAAGAPSVAERELHALLGAHALSRRSPPPPPSSPPPPGCSARPTFPPHAIDPVLDRQWNAYVAHNRAHTIIANYIIVAVLVLIKSLQRYRDI